MGVSLQVYRSRIGTFQQPLVLSRKNQSKGSLKFTAGSKLKIVFVLLSLCCFTPIFVYLNEDSFKIQTTPDLASPTTACGPSTSSLCTPGLPLSLSACSPLPTDTPPPLHRYLLYNLSTYGYLLQPKPTDTPPPASSRSSFSLNFFQLVPSLPNPGHAK